MTDEQRRVVSVIVVNEASVLSRITNLFSGRGYNITSLTVAPIPDTKYSRLTIVTSGSVRVIEQITKQLLGFRAFAFSFAICRIAFDTAV